MSKNKFKGTIRNASLKDLNSILILEKNFQKDDRWSRDEFYPYLDKNADSKADIFIIAFNRSANPDAVKPAGCSFAVFDKPGHADLCSLVVDKKFRNQGLGLILLNRVCNRLKKAGAKKISLEVREDNEGAINLYARAGFVKQKILKGYYYGDKNALRMVRTFTT